MKLATEMRNIAAADTGVQNPHTQRFLVVHVYGTRFLALIMKNFAVFYNIFSPYAIIFPHGSIPHLSFNAIYWTPCIVPVVVTLAPMDRAKKNERQLRLNHVLDGLSAATFVSSLITGVMDVTTQEAIPRYLRGVILTQAYSLPLLLPLEYLDYQIRHHQHHEIPRVLEGFVRCIYRSIKFSTAPSAFLGIFANNLQWMDRSVIWYSAAGLFGSRLLYEAYLFHQSLHRRAEEMRSLNKTEAFIEDFIQNGIIRGLSFASLVYIVAVGYYAIAHHDEVTVPYLEGFMGFCLGLYALYITGSVLESLYSEPRVEILADDEDPDVTPRVSQSGHSFLENIGGGENYFSEAQLIAGNFPDFAMK